MCFERELRPIDRPPGCVRAAGEEVESKFRVVCVCVWEGGRAEFPPYFWQN